MENRYFLQFFILIFMISYSSTLECYVCNEQEDNNQKCLNTIKTCEQGEDICLTEIKWGTMPYWQLGADKQYYISKRCATKSICEKTRSKYMPYCTHIWYEDWQCAECCQGDRCNYYIITGCSTAKSSITMILLGAFSTYIFYLYLK